MKTKPNADAALRQRAEAQFKTRPAAANPPETAAGALRLKQELEIHQIELEMQNEELRAAQVEIKAGLERYTELFDFAPAGYFTLTADGTIRLVNLTGATLLGSERAHLIGKRLNVLVAEGDRKIFTGFLDRVFTGSESETCRVWLALEGRPARIVRLDSRRAAEGDCCRVVMLDITEHHRAEEKLRQSESELNRAQATARIGNWSWEMRHDRVTWSPEMYRIFGVQPETFEHSLVSVNQLIHPDDLPGQAQAIEAFLQGQPFKNYEYRVIRPDKDIRVVEVISSEVKRDTSGRPILVSGTVQDITVRKRAEDALEESNKQVTAILNSISDAFFSLDNQLVVTYWNDAAEQILHHPRVEVLGRNLFEAFPEARGSEFETRYRRAILEKQPDAFETFFQGEPYQNWYSVRVYPQRDGISIFFHLINERKQMEAVQSFLAQTTSGKDVGGFFNALAAFLAENLRMDFVCIDRLEGDGLNARTLAVWHDGKFEDNVTYALKDTPCGDVVGKQVCCFTAGVTKLFPKDQVLQDLHAESYAGVTLFDHAGKPIGLIAVISRKPLVNRAQTEAGLKMVAVRAAGELERQQAEAKMREAQNLLQAAMDHSPAGIAIADAPDGKLRYVNNAGLLIRGGDRESIVHGVGIDQYVASWQLLDLDGKRPLQPEEVPLIRAIRFGEVNRREFIIRRSAGDDRIVSAVAAPILDPQGKVIAAIVIFDDITERKRAEESHSRLAMAVEQAAEAIIITDVEGAIIYVNPAFEKISGYTRAEAMGQNPRILKSGKQDGAFYRQMWKTINLGEVWSGRFINQRKDGALYEEESTITPIHDKAGKIVNFVAVERDVTHEVELEGQLRQSQKMEAMGTLAGGIAHDFNNILNIIFGYSNLLQMDLAGKPDELEKLREILKAGERAKELVQQILTFSRRQEQERRVIHLNTVIKETVKLLRASLPANLEIETELAADAPMVLADATQIYQVIMNLSTNALHAMEKQTSGKLNITLDTFQPEAAFLQTHPKLRAIKYARLTISDTGCGMDATTLARIYDPFFTTKPVGKGTGLGLAVVHGIVESHDGVITVESQPGQGTIFQIYFPEQIQDMLQDGIPESLIPCGQGQRILMVDDEVVLVGMYQKLFKALKYEGTIVTSPEEAVALIRKNPAQFDLVITDLTMPGMSGLEVARRIRAIREDLPIILATGFHGTVSDRQLADAGICEVVEKPISMAKLAMVLRGILGKT